MCAMIGTLTVQGIQGQELLIVCYAWAIFTAGPPFTVLGSIAAGGRYTKHIQQLVLRQDEILRFSYLSLHRL